MELEEALVDPRLKIDARRPHVPDHLAGRLFEQEIQASLPTPTCGVGEMRRERRLARAGRSRIRTVLPR